jgi:anti-sigma factor RsiW
MIECKSALPLIEPYLDGELDASQMAEIRVHLNGCPNCTAAHQRLSDLSANLRTLRYPVPGHLQDRIVSAVRSAAQTQPPARFPQAKAWAIAASTLLAISLGSNITLLRFHKPSQDNVAQQIVSSHIRSLIGAHLLDIPSTDQHNVKPWFNGKLDYAPEVKDLAAAGFPLIGGRVDYIDHRPVAVMVYKRAQHVINLFAWPSNSPLAAPETSNGFNLVIWNKGGITYCAISDLNKAELNQFATLYR